MFFRKKIQNVIDNLYRTIGRNGLKLFCILNSWRSRLELVVELIFTYVFENYGSTCGVHVCMLRHFLCVFHLAFAWLFLDKNNKKKSTINKIIFYIHIFLPIYQYVFSCNIEVFFYLVFHLTRIKYFFMLCLLTFPIFMSSEMKAKITDKIFFCHAFPPFYFLLRIKWLLFKKLYTKNWVTEDFTSTFHDVNKSFVSQYGCVLMVKIFIFYIELVRFYIFIQICRF